VNVKLEEVACKILCKELKIKYKKKYLCDKPDIQINNDIGCEVTEVILNGELRKMRWKLFGNNYCGKIAQSKIDEIDKYSKYSNKENEEENNIIISKSGRMLIVDGPDPKSKKKLVARGLVDDKKNVLLPTNIYIDCLIDAINTKNKKFEANYRKFRQNFLFVFWESNSCIKYSEIKEQISKISNRILFNRIYIQTKERLWKIDI